MGIHRAWSISFRVPGRESLVTSRSILASRSSSGKRLESTTATKTGVVPTNMVCRRRTSIGSDDAKILNSSPSSRRAAFNAQPRSSGSTWPPTYVELALVPPETLATHQDFPTDRVVDDHPDSRGRVSARVVALAGHGSRKKARRTLNGISSSRCRRGQEECSWSSLGSVSRSSFWHRPSLVCRVSGKRDSQSRPSEWQTYGLSKGLRPVLPRQG